MQSSNEQSPSQSSNERALSQSSNEQALAQLAQRLKQQYQALDDAIDAMNQAGEVAVETISDQLTSIRQTESMLKPLRDACLQTHEQLPPEIRTPTNETIELLRGLMPKLAQLEKTTLQSAQQLLPKIQQSVRAVQMQTAYRAGSRS